MKTLYITYDSYSTGGEAESDEKWCSFTPKQTTVNFRFLHRDTPRERFFYDSFEVDDSLLEKNELFLAVVRYSTGDTFGSSHGMWHIHGAFADYETALKELEEVTKPSPKGGYKPWEGYFESLEGIEVHCLKVV